VKFKCARAFFETSFGRIYSRRILLVSVEAGWRARLGECVAGKTRITAGMDGDRLAYDQHYLAPLLMQANGCGPGLRGALCAGARPSHVQSGPGKRGLGRRGTAEADPLWKLLGGTRREIACGVSIGIQDSPEQLLGRSKPNWRRIPPDQDQSQAGMGFERPGDDSRPLGRYCSQRGRDSAYTLDEIEHLRKFDAFNLLMIEQPL